MLGIDTPQPDLDFQSTVFPALSLLTTDGRPLARLSVQANPEDGGAFGDVVSGAHAITFSDDGALAFVADTNSEDILVVDAARRVEATVVRPLPGHSPEAVVWANGKLYVQERNTEDVAVFRVDQSDGLVSLDPQGSPFPSVSKDPMPSELRLGQKLFYSANSDDVPTTQNHWVACASCHLEGRSDAVTWLFAQGPRDTPTNAGGLLDTGFLFRTADRNKVEDYWQTIDVEQGGHFSANEPAQQPLLEALAAYVNHAIPTPAAPSEDVTHAVRGDALAELRARGLDVFDRVGCGNCHSGPAKTDSGAGNPALDLSGPPLASPAENGVLLHDVGTCVTSGTFPDVGHADIEGHPRDACAFDTPQLRGLADSAPYLHDGSAASLSDVVPIMLRACAPPGETPPKVSDDEATALVEYLRGL
jgi:cytochrome c peroxidase